MNLPASTQKLRQIRFGLLALFCLLTLVAEVAEYQFFHHLKENEKRFASNDLSSIGQLKASQLAAFLKERRGDSLVLTDLLSIGLNQNWWTARDKALPASLQQPLKSVVAYYDYTGAMILDAKGNVRFRIGRSIDLSQTEKSFIRQIVQTAPPPFSELYAADQAVPEQPMLDTFAPIKSADKTTTVGVLVLRGDWPNLFAMIQAWPVESPTAETLLLKQDNDQVMVLNELRHRAQTTLRPHLPIKGSVDAPLWPIIKSAPGEDGLLETFDYRGQAVLAHVLPVQGAPWNLVVKMDTAEVLEHLQFLQSIAASGTLIAAAGLGLWGYSWQRRREQARIRHEAQQVEHRLASVIGSAMDAIISVDEDQRIVMFNPTAERLFRCSAQETLGQPLDRFIPHRFRDAHREHIRTFGLSGKTTRTSGALMTVNGTRADGQEFPMEASISKTQTDGRTLYTVILRDISERIRTESALTQSEERLRLALAAANQGLYDLNVQTGECIVSPEYALMLGHDPAEFRETNAAWRERLHPDDREEAYRTYGDYVAGRRDDYRVEFRQLTKAGGWKWISSIGRLVSHSADGRPLRMLGIHTDITERKQTEDRLAEAHAMLNLVLNNIPLYVFWKDRTSTYLGCNALFAQAAGLQDPQAIIGKTDFELAWKDSAELYRADDRTVMKTNTPKLNFEEPQIRPDGTVLWLSTSKVPLQNREGKVFGVLGIYEDITERKKAFERETARARTLRQLSELGLQLSGTPDEIFQHVVRMIGELFEVRVVCLSEIVGSDLSFKAVYVDGEVFSNAGSCPLDVTPCATVEITRDLRLYDRVAERFPQASFLRDHKAYAYCGFPSFDGAGRVSAVTCLLDDKPREFSEEDQGILRIIGQRIATEVERMRAEASLHANETRLREAQTLAQIGSWELDLDTSKLTWSEQIFRIFEIDPTKFAASYEAFLDAIHPDDRDRVNEAYTASVQTRKPYEIVHRLLMPDGRIKYVQERCQTFYDEATGKPLRSSGTVQDITALKQAELRIEASLREKETLLREVHHRVKNNLQIISSLLHFQAKKAQKEHEQSIFAEGQDRLRAMILVHELLYRSTDLHRIALGEYLKALTDQLRHSFRETAGRVHLRVEADDLSVPAAIALPCGMIVTELVTNSFKYAYPAGTSGPLLVRLAAGKGSFLLSVSDEGTGLPAGLDLAQTGSFGLHLVANLAEQLGATLTRPPGTGTTIALEIPLPHESVVSEYPLATHTQPVPQPEGLL